MRTYEKRFDRLGEWRLMARTDGYVMARRPGCVPQVFSAKEWDAMLLHELVEAKPE